MLSHEEPLQFRFADDDDEIDTRFEKSNS